MNDERKPTPFSPEFWDERYAQEHFVYGEAPNAFLAEQAHRLPQGARVLLPADGEGRNGVWLAEQGHDVVTVDLSSEGPKKARALAARRGVSIRAETADLAHWDWPVAGFDAVGAFYFHLVPDLRPALHARMVEALKPGGLILLEAFRPEQIEYKRRYGSGGPREVEMLMTPEMLRADFAPAEPLLLEEAVVELDEGAFHSGPAAVVRAVFRKGAA